LFIFLYCPLLLVFPFPFFRLGKFCWHPCLMRVHTTASIMLPMSMWLSVKSSIFYCRQHHWSICSNGVVCSTVSSPAITDTLRADLT
jgi:hypothetical protein